MAYDAATGAEIWRAKVCGGEMTPSPAFGAGLVFTAIDAEKLTAIRPDGAGDVTTNKVVWNADEGLPDIVSPVCDGQRVYTIPGSGLVVCYDAATGKKQWEKDFETEVQASPIAAAGRIYLFTKEGVGLVLEAANEFKEIARSKMGEEIQATPALTDGRIFVRGRTNLFALGVKK
jgi:outer membrane protein assembly factor BamB